MTEAEWLACDDPTQMLEFVQDKASDRKIRLFTVACARTVWDYLSVEDMRTAVETGERFADGLASDAERHQIMNCLYAMPLNARKGVTELSHFFSATSREQAGAYFAALVTVRPGGCHSLTRGPAWEGSALATGRQQPQVLKDIFGPLPFRNVTLDLSWLTTGVVALARQMYESRDFSAMPILADALQDAGCDSEDILSHCRGGGSHVRGCWVADLVLGKE